MKQEINQEDQTKTATKRPKVKWVTCEILVSTSESTCIRFDSIQSVQNGLYVPEMNYYY